MGNKFSMILKNMYFNSIHVDLRLTRVLENVCTFPLCGVDSGSPFNAPREKRTVEIPQRSEEAQAAPAGKRASHSGNQRIHYILWRKLDNPPL